MVYKYSKFFIPLILIISLLLLFCSCNGEPSSGGELETLGSCNGEPSSGGELETLDSLHKVNASYELAKSVERGKRYCDKVGRIDQSLPPSYSGFNITDTSDVEKEYNDIEVKLRYETYPLNAYIYVHVVNADNKMFDVFSIPYIEKWDSEDNEWVRLSYSPDSAYYESNWYACEGYMVLQLNPYYVYEPIEEGTYRLIVFAGGKSFYTASFEFIEKQGG